MLISAALHGGGLAAWLLFDQLQVAAVAGPLDQLTYFELALHDPPSPPPPLPPTGGKTVKKKERVEPVRPVEEVAPVKIPETTPPEPEKEAEQLGDDEQGDEHGDKGGKKGGVEGGLDTGREQPERPEVERKKVEPTPPPEVQIDEATARGKRRGGRELHFPENALNRGVEATLTVTLKIGADGHVKQIIFLRSHPLFERPVRETIETWLFEPIIIGGRAVPWTTTYRINFQLR